MEFIKYIVSCFFIAFIIVYIPSLAMFIFQYEIEPMWLSALRYILAIIVFNVPTVILLWKLCADILFEKYIKENAKTFFCILVPFVILFVPAFGFTRGFGNLFYSNYYGIAIEGEYENRRGDEFFIPKILFQKSIKIDDAKQMIVSKYDIVEGGVDIDGFKKKFIYPQAGVFEGYEPIDKEYSFGSILFYGIYEKLIITGIYFLVPLLILSAFKFRVSPLSRDCIA